MTDLDDMPLPDEIKADMKRMLHGESAAELLELASDEGLSVRCQTCETTLGELSRGGLMGCTDCYQTFREQLYGLMPLMHQGKTHTGRCPGQSRRVEVDAGLTDANRELLQQELRDAVVMEDFERAAALRDSLAALSVSSGN